MMLRRCSSSKSSRSRVSAPLLSLLSLVSGGQLADHICDAEYGNRIPLEIKNKFRDILRDSYMIPSLTHYLSFMDAWRSGDLPTAFDYLHRYFDYTMQDR